MRRSLALALALLLASAPAAAFFLDTCVEPGDEVAESFFRAPTFDTTPAPTRLGGRLYAIPRNYFNFPHVSCATSDNKGMLLRMTLPDLLPRTPETEELLHGSEAAYGITFVALVGGPLTVRTPQALAYRRPLQGLGDGPPKVDGLKGQFEGPLTQENTPRTHVYYYPNRRETDFIAVCFAPEATPRPDCTIWFEHNNAQWKAHTDRIWLDEWSTLIPALRAKIDGFLVDGPEGDGR